MGFWGKLGKIGLKVAPIAAMAIPGVGPLASMAIGAGTSALSKKLEGGSWKDAALAGGIGGATGYLGGRIGPSDPTKFLKGDVASVAAKATGKSGLLSKIGNIATQTGKSVLNDKLGGTGGSPGYAGGTFGGSGIVAENPNEASEGWQNMLSKYLKGRGDPLIPSESASTPPYFPRGTTGAPPMGSSTESKNVPGVYGWQGQGFGDFESRNPNLGAALQRGKMKARRGLSPSYVGAY